MQVVEKKQISQQDYWLRLRVCIIGETVLPAQTNNQLAPSTPSNSQSAPTVTKPFVKHGQDSWIQLSKLKSFNPSIAKAGNSSQCPPLESTSPNPVSPQQINPAPATPKNENS